MSGVKPSAPVRARRIVRQLHRWIGLLVALQLLLWVAGGVVMSFLKLDEVRGEAMRAKHPQPALASIPLVVPVADLLARPELKSATAVTLTTFLSVPAYRVDTPSGPELYSAMDGNRLSPLAEPAARQVAQQDYAGSGRLVGMEWIDQPASEYRGRDLPLWRARFDDERETTIYISPQSGQVVARRNELWRIFDFFWMLHIMDYQEREDFNHPLLVSTAITALLFVFTGIVMLGYSFLPRKG